MKIPLTLCLAGLSLLANLAAGRASGVDKPGSSRVVPGSLKCEYQVDPVGIDVVPPRLSWQLSGTERGQHQTAFQVLVASEPARLAEGHADRWDSGKVSSGQSVHVPYAGKTLASRDRCFWKVRVWDKDGAVTPWSEPARWSMGLLQQGAGDGVDAWQARWIGSPDPDTAPLYRTSFHLRDVSEEAVLFIAALGYFELYVNGEKVGRDLLAPAVSNYQKRTYYRSYEVGRYLKTGWNHLGVRMGRGWYSPGLPGVVHHSPVFRARLDFLGSAGLQPICSDTTWKTRNSGRSLLGTWRWGHFGGERVEAAQVDPAWWRADTSTEDWKPVVEVEVPKVPCRAQYCAGNVPLDPITPVSVEPLPDGSFVLDAGRNLTGMMKARFRNLKAGQQVTLHYADLDARSLTNAVPKAFLHKGFAVYRQRDEFVPAGGELETFDNVFNYHGFRYVLIEGLPYRPVREDFSFVPVETGVAETGSFRCSNDLFNRIHAMVRWTYRCLNLGGQTVDCPHRERLGYGDGQTIMDTGCFNFDAATLYTKWSQNWWDEQKEDGFVPFTAPCPHPTGGGPAWGAMCIMVPWKTYLFYGDTKLLRDGYPYMKRYMDYLDAHCSDDLLEDASTKKWHTLGDWVPPRRGMDRKNWVDPESRRFFNNCYRVHLLEIMKQVAVVLDREEDVKHFEDGAVRARAAIHEASYQPASHSYVNGEQPYLLFPLMTGVTPEAEQSAVFETYVKTLLETDKGHLNSGMIGTQIVTDYLLSRDRNDLIATYVNQRTYPGWGYMIEQGATTCWEQWNGYFSRIHSCFPYIGGWFYRGLAGIQWDPDAPGFKHVMLRPGVVEGVDWVDCSYRSPYGQIVSNWKRKNGTFFYEVHVPPNSTATVYLPAVKREDLKENGRSLDQAKGVTFLGIDGQRAVVRVEAGRYSFESRCP